MKFFPYRQYEFHSSLSGNEIRNRLNCLTRASSAFRAKYYPQIGTHMYTGDVHENEFDISRRISYRNSFLPVIKGKMESTGTGTAISVRMRLNIFAIIFACVWFGALGAVCIGLFILHFYRLSSAAVPLMMIVFGYLLFTIPFLIEAGIARRDLERLVESEAIFR